MFNILNPGSGTGSSDHIQELFSDPASPTPEEVWVLRSGGSGGIPDGTPIGLLLALTYTGNAGSGFTYQLSYQTLEGPIIRVTLS